jgi:hypothetical protein
MRSVVVVLPASIWAMMPIFLVFSKGNALGTVFSSNIYCDLILWQSQPLYHNLGAFARVLPLVKPITALSSAQKTSRERKLSRLVKLLTA